MPDDLKKKRPQDAKRINLGQPHEVRYWCSRFQCSELKLRQAVDAVGDSAARVGDYLAGR